MSGLEVWRCESCGRRMFPRRELCPHCGGVASAPVRAERGIASEITSHRGVDIASVRVDGDVTVVARVDGSVTAGSEVTLRLDDGAPVATVNSRKRD
jgi:uncharacterized OB-fold protein